MASNTGVRRLDVYQNILGTKFSKFTVVLKIAIDADVRRIMAILRQLFWQQNKYGVQMANRRSQVQNGLKTAPSDPGSTGRQLIPASGHQQHMDFQQQQPGPVIPPPRPR